MSLDSRLRDFCPPILFTWLKRRMRRSGRYDCGYRTWAEAQAASEGYDAASILERVAAATRKVVAGEAAYERDTVLFSEPVCPFHLLMPLQRAMLERRDGLSVIDFGGSLGSTYRQCRPYLGETKLRWNVIEQSAFVAAGRAEFQTDELRFFDRVEDVPEDSRPDVFLLSSSLQYLDDPEAVLQLATRSSSRYLVIDRTPFTAGGVDEICVQHVPRHIYPASYPVRIFGYDRVRRLLAGDWASEWEILVELESPEGRVTSSSGRLSFDFRGLILRRKHVE